MANLQDLKKFDLNLLVIFECIYLHRSVSKAAEALFLTPSAISQSLQRLRNQLNDPLFIRSGKGITPTTVGTNLHIYLEDNLNQLEQTINIMQGAPLRKNFVIYCTQSLAIEFFPTLATKFFQQSDYELIHYDSALKNETAEDLLIYRKADVIIGLTPILSHSIICKPCVSEEAVVVCSVDHPRLKETADAAMLAQEKFTLFQGTGKGQKDFHVKTEEALPERRIAFRSNSAMSILAMLSRSELVGIVPLSVYERYKTLFPIKRVDIAFPLPKVEYYMAWNRAALANPAVMQLIADIEGYFAARHA